MNLRPRRTEEPEVNLTPLIDVVFLMLIFFMVSTTFLKESDLQVVLPQASGQPQEALPDVVELHIDAEGQYVLNGEKLLNTQTNTVRLALERVFAEGERPLVIRADKNTAHQAVVTAFDAAGQAGISRVSIATTPDEE